MVSQTLSVKTFLGLILCNLVWSLHPTLGKWVLEDFSPVQGSWLRYASTLFALVCFSLCAPFFSTPHSQLSKPWIQGASMSWGRSWGLAALLGFLCFCYSPLMQMTGLAASRATDNALIVAMEPIATVILARIVLGEALTKTHWVSFALSLLGFSLLTGITFKTLFGAWDPHLTGNLIMAGALLGEASYSIIARKLLLRFKPVAIFGSALLMGVLFLTFTTVFFAEMPDLQKLSTRSLVAILIMGPLGTAAAYIYWMVALREAPIASLAITLFVQPVMGSIFGVLLLGERLTETQAFGGALILLAVLAQTGFLFRPSWPEKDGKVRGNPAPPF